MTNLIKLLALLCLPSSVYSATLDVTTGPTSGNTTVIILAESGEMFGTSVEVTVGGLPASLIAFGPLELEIKTPEGIGEDLNVEITSSTGTIIANDLFNYEKPSITNISPAAFFTRGGEIATISGDNFGTMDLGVAEVLVGGNIATVITQTHIELTIRIPEGLGTNQNVRVRVGSQVSDAYPIDYLPPSIWKVEPENVNPGPGDTIYICGVNFGNGFELPQVRVGNVLCGEVVYAGDDRLYAVTGIGTPSGLDVQVQVGGQASGTYTLKNKKPEFISVSDIIWNPEGGESVTIFANFLGTDLSAISLDLNGEIIPINSLVGNSIMFNSIPGTGKERLLKITVNGVESDVFAIDYQQSTLTDISPSSGSTLGGQGITISGIGIGGGSVLPEIYFGDIEASNVVAASNNELTCILPPGVGTIDVKLELNGEASNSLPFSYNSPLLIGLNPIILPLTGDVLVISGIELGNADGDAAVFADGQELLPRDVNFGSMTVDLPPGFGQGKTIEVKVGGILSNALTYSYVAPSITGINPSLGFPGEVLSIQGSNLGGLSIPTSITIDGNPAGILTSSGEEIRCIIPAGSGANREVVVTLGNTSDSFTGFTYDDTPPIASKKVEVVGQLRVTDLPFANANGILLGVDSQGNLVKNTSPQISVSITNDTLFLGPDQFIVIPGISKANGGN